MMKSLIHRGPDGQGFFFDDTNGVAFGHNRLSIIDLTEGGHQPMMSEDKQVVLVYNGEIYNFKELRKELEGLGHRFRSQCDTEVVLQSFIQWGEDCVNRFCGMFAFAIWSVKDKKLFLARDPMGMKPLYYACLPNNQGFVFASEIKVFLALPDFTPRLNSSSLQQFIEFGYIYDVNETSLEGIFKLPPGHILEVFNGYPNKPTPFFMPRMPDYPNSHSLEEFQSKLHSSLTEVVFQHLVADVPVGLLLSGGLDSSVIAAIAARQQKIRTINMSFSESNIDERFYARLVSKHIGSDHHEVIINSDDLINDLEKVFWYVDDLFTDFGLISTRLLYKKCREMGIKVVIVGEGSDELFSGYSNIRYFERDKAHFPNVWKLFQLYRRYAGRRYGKQFIKFYVMMNDYLRQSKGDMLLAIRLFQSKNQLPNNYVMKVDKASMSVSVEARAPYLDRRIAELVYQIPNRFLFAENTNKWILRSMTDRYKLLPKEIIDRPKYGASMAMSWMDDSRNFREYSRKEILRKNSMVDKLGLRKAMEDYFDNGKVGYPFPHSISLFRNLAWRLLLLNLWSQKYLRLGGA